MMKLLKNLQKSIKAHHLMFLGLVVAVVAIGVYSSQKSKIMDMMTNTNPVETKAEAKKVQDAVQADNDVKPSAPLGENEEFAVTRVSLTAQSRPCRIQPRSSLRMRTVSGLALTHPVMEL
jgi:hypothetical protein